MLESISDLQLGIIDAEEWLKRMCKGSGSDSMCVLRWTSGHAETAVCAHSHEHIDVPIDRIEFFDRLIFQANLQQPVMLDSIARESGLPNHEIDGDSKSSLLDPRLMIALLDTDPARILMIFERAEETPPWDEADRERTRTLLPALYKSHLVHKRLVQLANKLDMANKVVEASTRGRIVLTPEGIILRANPMAQDVIDRGNGFSKDFDGRLVILDARASLEFYTELKRIRSAPLSLVGTINWNKSFRKTDGTGTYQVYMRAFGLEEWRLESNAHDRFVIIFIGDPEQASRPNIEQLQNFYDVTAAEAKVLLAMFDDNDVNVTAAALNVSVNTVRSHLRTIYAKLGVNDKTELVRMLTKTLIGYERLPPDK
ncbi:MAG: helix-turn-helix transcriptional regulator [Gammaproteobacteria bacterium]